MAFKSNLPLNWALQYEDTDGDRIMLTSDEDYKAMLECELDSSSKSVKIFLLPLEECAGDLPVSKINDSESSKIESLDVSRILENQEISQKPSVNQKTPREEILIKTEQLADTEDLEHKNVAHSDADIGVSHENYFEEGLDERCSQFREERGQRMRSMVADVVLENIPFIAELVKGHIKNSTRSNVEVTTNKSREGVAKENAVRPVHYMVTCDRCGTNPIIGVRYKCAVCEDFDYCEKCEKLTEHAHPFLKIKDPKHHPRAMITILEEDFPIQSQENLGKKTEKFSQFSKEIQEKMSKAIDEISEKLFVPTLSKEQTNEVSAKTGDKEQIKLEKIEIPQKEDDLLGLTFVKEICTIPARITVNDKAIYKTISLKNSGKNEWSSGSFVQNIGGVAGQDTRVVQLAPGKEFSCILILENPAQPGDYVSSWRLAFYDDKGHVQHSGEPFTVTFTVIEPELIQSQVKKAQKTIKENNDKKLIKQYSKKMQETAQQLKEIFPEADINHLLEIVNQSPKLSIEELIESYLTGSQ